jgi:hydroxymethylbilane synthase
MTDLIDSSQIIGWDEMLPAVAQGAIGIQCRSDDDQMLKYLAPLNHPETKLCVDCERSFLATLDGNCRTPIAGQACVKGGQLHFRGMISKPDGTDMITVERVGNVENAVEVGLDAGNEIKSIAGDKFIEYQQAVAQASQSVPANGGWSNLSS